MKLINDFSSAVQQCDCEAFETHWNIYQCFV